MRIQPVHGDQQLKIFARKPFPNVQLGSQFNFRYASLGLYKLPKASVLDKTYVGEELCDGKLVFFRQFQYRKTHLVAFSASVGDLFTGAKLVVKTFNSTNVRKLIDGFS
ncbi:MAG: Uncharacterised protein [Cryomorphaceae bacterium]|nr:MAG: Uncharacterised protein [Cryomorphaceae bacterium]